MKESQSHDTCVGYRILEGVTYKNATSKRQVF